MAAGGPVFKQYKARARRAHKVGVPSSLVGSMGKGPRNPRRRFPKPIPGAPKPFVQGASGGDQATARMNQLENQLKNAANQKRLKAQRPV